MDNNVVYDRIDELMVKAEEIKSSLADVQADVIEFGGMLENVQAFTNETNVVVKDILNGRQLSEWIADLAASGKSSATYADSSRMQALAEDTDACKNVQVTQHIFDWSVINNKVGTYYNSYFGAVSGVTWDKLTTPSLVYANSNAFKKIANDSDVFKTAMSNSAARVAMFNNYGTTESIINSSSVAMSYLNSVRKFVTIYDYWNDDYKPITGKLFILSASNGYNSFDRLTVSITNPKNSVSEIDLGEYRGYAGDSDFYFKDVKKFASKVSAGPSNTTNTVNVRYVDFS